MRYITSTLFSINMVITTIITATLASLLIVFPVKLRFHIIRRYGTFNIWMLKILCGIRYEVHGKENIPKQTGIIFSKHESTWETLALQQIFPSQTFVIKRELLWVPFFGWGLATLKPIAIDRKAGRNAIKQVVSQGIQRLKDEIWIVIFPEGTRVRPGQIVRFKIGGAILAAESGCPIVPVAHNAGDFWQKGQFLKKPGTIKLMIGPPIESKDKKAEDILAEAEGWIRNAMAELRPGTPTE